MFVLNDKLQCFIRTDGDIVFVCSEYKPEYETKAEELLKLYPQKLLDIVCFIKPEIDSFYQNEFTVDTIIDNLGYPTIDVELNTISYVDHKFDEEHIIIIEFDGMIDNLMNTIIDG